MRVLLTGASGFVGSHVLDRLLARQISVAVLLRPSSSRAFLAEQLVNVDVCPGGLDDPASLDAALSGVTHIIHCAGATKALDATGFFAVNQQGTRNLVAAVNRLPAPIQRFVHISSLAAAGPATADRPKSEREPLQPVSDYGRSKAAAENEVSGGCRCDWTIIRPPAVYGPRDFEFLRLFKAVQSHLLPRFGGGRQQLTLAYVGDLAEVVVAALFHPSASREIFFAGSPEVVTAAQLAQRIAGTAGTWTIPLPLPQVVLWLACQWAGLVSRITRQPNVLNAQKYAELVAPGWVCDVAKLRDRLGCVCPTTLAEGVAKTRAWYLAHGWLRA